MDRNAGARLPAQGYDQAALEAALECLSAGGELRLRVISGSMAPLIRPGDTIVARRLLSAQARRGDIVVGRQAGALVTHRVAAITPGGLVTKGDALLVEDPLLPYGALVGRVEAVEHGRQTISFMGRNQQAAAGFLGWLAWQQVRAQRLTGAWQPGPLRKISRLLIYAPLRLVAYLIQWSGSTGRCFRIIRGYDADA